METTQIVVGDQENSKPLLFAGLEQLSSSTIGTSFVLGKGRQQLWDDRLAPCPLLYLLLATGSPNPPQLDALISARRRHRLAVRSSSGMQDPGIMGRR